MAHKSELVFQYDDSSFVISAKCSLCGDKMPQPPANVTLSRDRVLWFAKRFLEHKKQLHAEAAVKLRKAS